MAKIINLNKRRKAKKRAHKEQQAIENRIKFGRTKAEKQMHEKAKQLEIKKHEGHKLDD